MPTNVPAVASSVRILERLAVSWPDAVTPRDLILDLGLNRSTCYNIMATLQHAGWVRTLGNRAGWTLGPRLLTMTGVTDTVVFGVMQEEIEALTRRLGFVVFIAEPDGSGGYVVVAKAEHRHGVRVTVGVGEYFQFSAPALMNTFYAWGAAEDFDTVAADLGVRAFTAKTITDRAELRGELERTRTRGYSVSLQQLDLSQSGIAAPVFDRRGRVARALCTLAFSSELNQDNIDRIGGLLADSAMRITERIGGQSPGTTAPSP